MTWNFDALFTYKQFTNNIQTRPIFDSSGNQIGSASLGYDSDNNHIVKVIIFVNDVTVNYTYNYGINLLNNNIPTFFNVLSYVFTNGNINYNVDAVKFKMDIDKSTNYVIHSISAQ